MHIIEQAWGGYLAYCDPCIAKASTRADPAPDRRDQLRHVAGEEPPWCLHCHACGQRINRHPSCPRCPCPNRHWLATHRAAVFGAALGRRLHHVHDLDRAWQLGRELSDGGFGPDRAADLAIQLQE